MTFKTSSFCPSKRQDVVAYELNFLGIPHSELPARLANSPLIAALLNEKGNIEWAATAYLAYVASKSRSIEGDTVRSYAESLVVWFDFLKNQNIDHQDVGEPEMQQYRLFLSKKAMSSAPATVALRLIVAVQYVCWCHQNGWKESRFGKQMGDCISLNFLHRRRQKLGRSPNRPMVAGPRVTNRIPFPIASELLTDLFAKLPPVYKLIFKWAISTGLRRFELCNLQITSLPRLDISTSASIQEIRLIRKGGKLCSVYVVPQLLNETFWYVTTVRTQPQPGAENYLFLNNHGGKISKHAVSRWFRKAADAVECKATFHGLRHTFAITVLRILEQQSVQGESLNPLKTLQVLMGHSSIETTDIYLQSLEITSPAVEKALGFLYGCGIEDELG